MKIPEINPITQPYPDSVDNALNGSLELKILNMPDVRANEKLRDLKSWLDQNGIWFDREQLDIRVTGYRDDPEYGMFALKDISLDESAADEVSVDNAERPAKKQKTVTESSNDSSDNYILCRIPKSAVFSVPNSHCAKQLEGYTGALGLTIAMCIEKLVYINESKWKGYFESLPVRKDSLPIFWYQREFGDNLCRYRCVHPDSEDVQLSRLLLEGTEVAISLKQDYQNILDDYDGIVLPLCMKNKWPLIPFGMFMDCASVVASRCFCLDNGVHGDSLVPLADLFNHVVDNNVRLETGDIDEDDANEEHNEDSEKFSEDNDENDDIEITLQRSVKKGEECFNTYGEHSNAYLLLKYGFALSDNPFDVVSFSSDLIVEYVHTVRNDGFVDDCILWWLYSGKDSFSTLFEINDDDKEGERYGSSVSDADSDNLEIVEYSNAETDDDNEEASVTFEDFFTISRNGEIPRETTILSHILLTWSPADLDLIKSIDDQSQLHQLLKDKWYPLLNEDYEIPSVLKPCFREVLKRRTAMYSRTVDADLQSPKTPLAKYAWLVRTAELEILSETMMKLQ